MLNDLSQFKWRAPAGKAGYRWEQRRVLWNGVPTVEWFLTLEENLRCRAYFPFKEESGLFFHFVRTEPTREGMLGFANRFGLLGEMNFECVDEPGPKEDGYIASCYLESLGEWRLQILWMRHLVHLWQNAVEENQQELSRWITFKGGKLVHRFPDPDLPKMLRSRAGYIPGLKDDQLVLTEDNTEVLSGLLRKKDVVLAALLLIQEGVLGWYTGILLFAKLQLDLEKRRLLLSTFPRNLVHGMWLQFMRAVDGNRKYRICPTCQRWFELAPGLNRADRTTCSNSCRTRAYLQRRQQAVEMHAAGKKVKRIARELGSDVGTINKWIGGKER